MGRFWLFRGLQRIRASLRRLLPGIGFIEGSEERVGPARQPRGPEVGLDGQAPGNIQRVRPGHERREAARNQEG